MPAERTAARDTAPVGRQRVRTGCLTCRKRRRKCDERKPRCENCETKGFSCEYRIDLAFVQSSSSASLSSNNSSSRTVHPYSSIKFIIADPATPSTPKENRQETPTPSSVPRNDGYSTSQFTAESRLNDDPTTRHSSDPVVPFSYIPRPVTVYPYDGDGNEMALLGPPLSVRTDRPTSAIGNKSTPHQSRSPVGLSFSSYLADGPEASIIHHETSLLRHYRYNVAPWIDIGDPESPFGIKIMLQAREDQSLYNAILALAASHRSIISQTSSDLESSRRYGQEAENGLPNSKEHIRCAARMLFMLKDFFLSPPYNWRDLLSRHLASSGSLSTISSLTEQLNAPLFWLCFRIDLATSITISQAPLLPFLSFLRSDGALVTQYQSLSQRKSPKQTFQHTLSLLASCLSLIFGTRESSYPDNEHPDGTRLASLRNLTSTGWTSLWNDCLGWYNNRPVELQQIVDIRGTEVYEVDLLRASSFPILIYTTPLALVSNAIYHITSLLLLTYKPRLLRTVSGPRSFMSPMWHSQTIAGISTTNDFPEQWDPILVAGLILVAKDMTHEAQQSAVLERLRLVHATTGMNLNHEIEALRSRWSLAGYNDEMIT